MSDKPKPCLKCAAKGWRDSMYAHATRDHDRLLAEAEGGPDANESGSAAHDVGCGVRDGEGGEQDAFPIGDPQRQDGGGGVADSGVASVRGDAPESAQGNAPQAVTKALPSAWAQVVASSEAREQEERDELVRGLIEAGEDYNDDFARVKRIARDKYGPGRLGQLLWVDVRAQMMAPAVHGLDPMWIDAFANYYASEKLIMLARKGLRAGGSSSACCALTRCAVFADRHLDAGTIGVVPIMSATRDEADGRFVTIRSYLRAIGFTPPQKKKARKSADDDDFGAEENEADEDGIVYAVPAGGVAGTFRTRRSTSGGGVIAIRDCHGHRIQFRILPALVKHGVGYTGACGLADESDLWPNDPEHHVNPAEKIFDRISERFTTTSPGAEFLIFSASYNPDSAHKRAIDDVILSERGQRPKDRDPVLDAETTHLVRLGDDGGRRDEESRRRLAMLIKSDDRRLWATGDPMSPDLPAWVYNPNETIEKCYAFSKRNISRMLAMYGGRAAENEGEANYANQCLIAAEMTHGIADRRGGVARQPDPGEVQTHPLARPGDARYAGPKPQPMGRPQTWRDRKVL